MSHLFSSFDLGAVHLENRIVISPMCQYSAVNGSATDWHAMHLGQFAAAGPGLIMLEATAVSPEGRITHGDLGLYSDENEEALRKLLSFIRGIGPSKIGIQLSHTGRKGSVHLPWAAARPFVTGSSPLAPEDDPWPTIGASALPHLPDWPAPVEMDEAEINRVVEAFAESAARANRLGFDVVEVHAAHGYLLHQFLSPISNRRSDRYGGSLQNRQRLLLEVVRAVRNVLDKRRAVIVRVSATDWVDGGLALEDTIDIARELAAAGVDAIDVSSGGISDLQRIPIGPGYQVHLSARIRKECDIPTIAVGLIEQPVQAERILTEQSADLIAIGRAALREPRWPWRAAAELGEKSFYPPQYERARLRKPRVLVDADKDRAVGESRRA